MRSLLLIDDFRYACRVRELLRQLHDQSRYRNTTRRPKKLGVVVLLYVHSRSMPHEVFGLWLHVIFLQLLQSPLQVAHFVLQVHDIVSWYFGALGLIKVFAV